MLEVLVGIHLMNSYLDGIKQQFGFHFSELMLTTQLEKENLGLEHNS